MNGNVYEWFSDVYNATFPLDDFAGGSALINPKGTKTVGAFRDHRGGGWPAAVDACCSFYRTGNIPNLRGNDLGFRLAMTK